MIKQKTAVDRDQGRRIVRVREINNMSQEDFAKALKVTRGAVGNWELGKGITAKNLKKISDEFEVSFDWLANNRGRAPGARDAIIPSFDPDLDAAEAKARATLSGDQRSNIPAGEIPRVAARIGMGSTEEAEHIQIPVGNGSVAALPIIDTWKIPEQVLRRRLPGSIKAVHIVECEGDSMEPRIRDGDFVFIDTGRRMPSPPGIFALNDGFGQTLKRLELIPNSEPPRVMIIPENPRHQTYERNLDEVAIIGRYLCRLTMD